MLAFEPRIGLHSPPELKMEPEVNEALPFAEQLRALQEHGSTCIVSVVERRAHGAPSVHGELQLESGTLVRSIFGVLEGQPATDAMLAAGPALEYAITTRGLSADGEEESMIVPVRPWHDLSDDDAPVNLISDGEETRELEAEATPSTTTSRAQDPVEPSAASATAPNGAFEALQRPPRLPDHVSDAPGRRSSEAPPSHTGQWSPRVFFACLFFIALAIGAFWPRSAHKPTSTSAATSAESAAPSSNGSAAPAADQPHVAAEDTTAAAPSPSLVTGGPAPAQLESGPAPEAPAGALAPTIPVRVRVGSDGRVKAAELVAQRAGFAAQEQRALEAARSYRFQPAQQPGVDLWLTLPVRFRPTPLGNHVIVKGSDSIGATLLPAWVEALHTVDPHVTIDIESLGSTTGLAALLDGSADVASSSRLIRTDELALADKLGMQLRESFVGFDAIALVVHPENPLTQLDLDTIANMYVQRVTNWSELGGPDAPIHVLGRPGYSGTHRLFRERVLGRLGPDTRFGAQLDVREKSAEIVSEVAADPYAIGYVSSGLITPAVRALALAPQAGAQAVQPDATAIRDGSYPLARPLVLYVRPDSGEAAHQLVDFAISERGQAVVAEHGFVSVPAGPSHVDADTQADAEPRAQTAQPRELIRIYFEPSSARVAADSQPDLRAAIASVRADRAVLVVGNADSSGSAQDNYLLAQRRADAVAAELRTHGSHRATISVEVAAADHPIASNETIEGRQLNRRVDVIIQPPRH